MIRSLHPRMQWPRKCDSFRFDIFKVSPKWLDHCAHACSDPEKVTPLSLILRVFAAEWLDHFLVSIIKVQEWWEDYWFRQSSPRLRLNQLILLLGKSFSSHRIWVRPRFSRDGEVKKRKIIPLRCRPLHSVYFFISYFICAEIHICSHLMLCPLPPWL